MVGKRRLATTLRPCGPTRYPRRDRVGGGDHASGGTPTRTLGLAPRSGSDRGDRWPHPQQGRPVFLIAGMAEMVTNTEPAHSILTRAPPWPGVMALRDSHSPPESRAVVRRRLRRGEDRASRRRLPSVQQQPPHCHLRTGPQAVQLDTASQGAPVGSRPSPSTV